MAAESPLPSTQAVIDRLQQFTTLHASSPPLSNRPAAVLVALFVDETENALRVRICRRAKTLSTHAGECCLPGGKRDVDDVDDTATALREAHEEIGLAKQDILAILGPGPKALSLHGFSVTPILALTSATASLSPNPDEVDALFDMRLDEFLSSKNHSHSDQVFDNQPYRLHHFFTKQPKRNQRGAWIMTRYEVWGLTAHMLIQVAKAAYNQEPEFEECIPGQADHHTRKGE